jgi:hypothetical protein
MKFEIYADFSTLPWGGQSKFPAGNGGDGDHWRLPNFECRDIPRGSHASGEALIGGSPSQVWSNCPSHVGRLVTARLID